MTEYTQNMSSEEISYAQGMSTLSTERKIEHLSELQDTRKNLEIRLKRVDSRILVLEYMPDVAEYKIAHDEGALRLLEELRGTGDIEARNLIAKLTPKESLIFFHYLELLKTAQLIDMVQGVPGSSSDIIKLTKKGRDTRYK